jgi:hypothetical protein
MHARDRSSRPVDGRNADHSDKTEHPTGWLSIYGTQGLNRLRGEYTAPESWS